MCFDPVTIRNPRTFYRHGIDKLKLQVRCGKCVECRNEIENDWFVRLAYEYYACKENGGAVYFPTLTYNDDCLPLLDTTQQEFDVLNDVVGSYVEGVTPRCPQFKMHGFDKEQVRKFFKSFRQNSHSPYLPKDLRLNILDGVKYFLVSEYGGCKHRPHYHVLLFLPKKVDSYILKKVLELSWSDRIPYTSAPQYVRTLVEQSDSIKELLRHGQMVELERYFVLPPRRGQYIPQVFHRKGFVSWSSIHGSEVKSVACVRYVLKYLFKDSEFMKRPLVSVLQDYMDLLPPMKNIHNDAQLLAIKKLKDFFPFRLSSQKLGESLFKQLNIAELDADETQSAEKILINNQVSVPEDNCLYRVPQYIIRRLFYDHRDIGQKKNVCQINEIGKHILSMKYNYTVNYLVKRYKFCLEPAFVAKASQTFHDEFKCRWHITFDEFKRFVDEKFSGLFESFRDLAVYGIVYNDVSYENCPVDLTLKNLIKYAPTVFQQKIDTYNNKDEDYYFNLPQSLSQRSTAEFHSLQRFLYNELECFDKYQWTIEVLNFIHDKIMYPIIMDKAERKAYRESIHEMYTSYMYN